MIVGVGGGGGVTVGGVGVGVRGVTLILTGQFIPPKPVNSTYTGSPLIYSTNTHCKIL